MKINKNQLIKQMDKVDVDMPELFEQKIVTIVDIDKINRGDNISNNVIEHICRFLNCNKLDIVNCNTKQLNRVNWELDEACVMFDVFFKYKSSKKITNDVYEYISKMLRQRALDLGVVVDDKFRNITGIKMQMKCVEYVVSNGTYGLSSVGKIFYKAFDLYNSNIALFNEYVRQMYEKYPIYLE